MTGTGTAIALEAANDTGRDFETGQHSPCIGVCILDPDFASCQGCGRTADELGGWADMSAQEQTATWARIPNRLSRTARGRPLLRLMPWSPSGILAWAEDSLRSAPSGIWSFAGGTDVVFAFGANGLAQPDVQLADNTLTALTPTAALRLTAHEKLRAFAVGDPLQPDTFILTLPRGRVTIAAAEPGSPLGPDDRAIRATDRQAHLTGRDVYGAAHLLAQRDDGRSSLIAETDCLRIETTHPAGQGGHGEDLPNLPSWAAVMGVFRTPNPAV